MPLHILSRGVVSLLEIQTKYVLTEKRAASKTHSIKKRLFLSSALILLSFLIINSRFSPLLISLSTIEANRKTEEILAATVYREMSAAPTLYSDIVSLSYKSNGTVAALRTDTAKLIRMRTALVRAVLSVLVEEDLTVAIPIASLLGINFLSSRPAVRVTLRPTRTVNAYFTSSFEECGINQTRHRISFYMAVDILLLIPGKPKTVSVTRELPFAETVIVGDVPDAYTKIHRLTSDITEEEIDDIYDFGAVAN